MPFAFLSRHPDRHLQLAWNYAQLGVLIFPLSPFLGALGILLASFVTIARQYRKLIRRPVNWGLALLSVWLIITACFAYDRAAAFLGLFNFLPYFLVFVGCSALIQTPAQLRQWAWLSVITSVPVIILGLGQLFWGWTCEVHVLGIVVDWVVKPTGEPPGRMASIFMYANVLAGYLVIVFILGLGLWIDCQVVASHPKQPTRRLPQTTRIALLRWGFLSVAVIGNLIALILTDSRNAWALAASASLAFALYKGWHWLVAGVAALAGSVLWAAFGPPPLQQWLRAVVPTFFWARLTDQMYPDRPSQLLRTTQWQFAWSLTQQRPWTGWGLRNFTPLYLQQMHIWLGHPHSLLLMLSAETGIPGAVFFCGWVIWIVVQGFKLLSSWSVASSYASRRQLLRNKLIFFSYLVAVLACILFNTVDVSVFDPRLNMPGWLLLAAICGVLYHQRAIAPCEKVNLK